jgi:hypothetical protein
LNIRDRLRGGDRRELDSSDAVASDVLRHPEHFGELFEAMLDEDETVRIRAADAAEKATRGRPDLLVPLRQRLISEAGEAPAPEVRRRVAQMLPRIKLSSHDRAKAVALLERYLKEEHVDVAGAAMQSLADFSNDDAVLRERMIRTFERLARDKTPALAVRGQRLLAKLSSQQNRRRPSPKPRG